MRTALARHYKSRWLSSRATYTKKHLRTLRRAISAKNFYKNVFFLPKYLRMSKIFCIFAS